MPMNLSTMSHQDPEERALGRYGLLFGLLAGAAFAFTAWTIDAVALGKAHAYWFWLKLALGGSASLVIGAAAGWLVVRINRTAVTFLLWLLVGVSFGWLAAHVPFEGVSTVLERFAPALATLVRYPFTEGPQYRSFLTLVTTIGIGAFTGLLFWPLVDALRQAGSPVGRLFPAIIWIALFAGAGAVADNMMNKPLREPVVAVDSLVQFVTMHDASAISSKEARELHVAALNGVKDLLPRPRRLMLADYDNTIVMTNVLIDFGGTWAHCSVTAGQLGFCEPLK